jgi:hypothetical protein
MYVTKAFGMDSLRVGDSVAWPVRCFCSSSCSIREVSGLKPTYLGAYLVFTPVLTSIIYL